MATIFTRPTSPDVSNGNRLGLNGSHQPLPPAYNGSGYEPPRAGWTSRLGKFWNNLSFANLFSSKTRETGFDDEGNEGNGVHAITRKTDYWFIRELYQLEQQA